MNIIDIIWRLLSHTGSLVKGKLFNSRPKQQIASHIKSDTLVNTPKRSVSILRSDPTTSSTFTTGGNSSMDVTSNSHDEMNTTFSYSNTFSDNMAIQRSRALLLHVEPGTTMKKRPSMLLRALSTQSEEGTDKTESTEEGEPEMDEGLEGGLDDGENDEEKEGIAMQRESSTSSNPATSSSLSLSVMGQQTTSHMTTSIRQSRSNDQKSRLLFGKLYHAQND
jgi:hypothetical protein